MVDTGAPFLATVIIAWSVWVIAGVPLLVVWTLGYTSGRRRLRIGFAWWYDQIEFLPGTARIWLTLMAATLAIALLPG